MKTTFDYLSSIGEHEMRHAGPAIIGLHTQAISLLGGYLVLTRSYKSQVSLPWLCNSNNVRVVSNIDPRVIKFEAKPLV